MLATHNARSVNANCRVQFRFWLDVVKDAEASLAQEVQHLKSRRAFQPTIRDAIRLILDLRNGSTDVLHELFPWVSQQTTFVPVAPRLSAPAPMPDIEIKTAARGDENPGFNILLSSVGMGIAKLEDLSTACIEYGMAKGRISRSQGEAVLSCRKPSTGALKEQGIKTIAGSDVVFSAPVFDDLDLV